MKALNKKEHVLFCLKYQKEEGRLKNEVEAERGMPQRKTAGKNKNTGKKYACDSVWNRGKALKVDL